MINPCRVTLGSGRTYPVVVGNDLPFAFISGPCQLESRNQGLEVASELLKICEKFSLPFIFKSSFDKANRTSLEGSRGIGFSAALSVLAEIAESVGCPILTDVHEVSQCLPLSEVVDILQIPAFLCRQTDLLLAAGSTKCAVNIKKGQFLAPWDVVHIIAKLESTGNRSILLTERGTSFGYNTLVTDMRSISILEQTGYPVVFDATHSVQTPGGYDWTSGGQREFVSVLARAAVAVGVAAIFIETHPDPDHAPSDGANMMPLYQVPKLLQVLVTLDQLTKSVKNKLYLNSEVTH